MSIAGNTMSVPKMIPTWVKERYAWVFDVHNNLSIPSSNLFMSVGSKRSTT